MQLLGPEQLEGEIARLAAQDYCQDPLDILARRLDMLTPPESISTTEAARRFRWIRNSEGGGKRLWSLDLTPFLAAPQDAMDDPAVREVIVVGPGRSGKTKIFENHLFRRMRFGPLTDVIWYIGSGSEVDAYVNREVKPFFEDHPEIARKIGPSPSDNKLRFKRVAGRTIEYLPVNDHTVTAREAGLIIGDEIDTIKPARRRAAWRQQMRQRGRAIGSRRKVGMCSHPDAGWSSGIAQAWKESSRGMFVWPCAECAEWSSPHQLADWRTILTWHRDPKLADDDALDVAARTAAMSCPHCGADLNNDQRLKMVDAGTWLHAGQLLDRKLGPQGEPKPNEAMGFWIHALMMKNVRLDQLAKEVEAAMRVYEKTRKPDLIRELTAKTLGEVYEGAGKGARVLDSAKLKKRADEQEEDDVFEAGTFPRRAVFLTAAVDVGGKKFDVMIVAWDLEGRSWIVARWTIWQREVVVGGRRQMIDIRPGERQDDWIVLRDEVLRRLIPLQDDPGRAMTIAGMAIDTGGVEGVTPKAREFARRMLRDGESGSKGYRVRLVKGGTAKNAPEVGSPREINKDDEGHPISPSVREFTLNVDKLKALAIERLVLDEDGPGFVRFADGLPLSVYDELCGEVFIDGKFERRGANESLDLSGYNEAVRQLLQPERRDILWEPPERRPVWARPVPMTATGATLEPEPKKQTPSPIERMAALNKRRN